MSEIEFLERGIPFVSQHQLRLVYKGRTLQRLYKADFVCYDKIIVEVKAVSEIVNDHRAQTIHYLRATGTRLGILVNFCSSPELEHERLVV
jgi:GxxExxY protein